MEKSIKTEYPDTIPLGNINVHIMWKDNIPYFYANDIIVKLLDNKQIADCSFYRSKKNNMKLFLKVNKDECPQSITDLNGIQYNNQVVFMTQQCVYKVLMQSKSKHAEQFQDGAAKLFEGIQQKEVGVTIQKEGEFSQFIQDTKNDNTIFKFIFNYDELLLQINCLADSFGVMQEMVRNNDNEMAERICGRMELTFKEFQYVTNKVIDMLIKKYGYDYSLDWNPGSQINLSELSLYEKSVFNKIMEFTRGQLEIKELKKQGKIPTWEFATKEIITRCKNCKRRISSDVKQKHKKYCSNENKELYQKQQFTKFIQENRELYDPAIVGKMMRVMSEQ